MVSQSGGIVVARKSIIKQLEMLSETNADLTVQTVEKESLIRTPSKLPVINQGSSLKRSPTRNSTITPSRMRASTTTAGKFESAVSSSLDSRITHNSAIRTTLKRAKTKSRMSINDVQWSPSNNNQDRIEVFARIRPFSQQELESSQNKQIICINSECNEIHMLHHNQSQFQFGRVFSIISENHESSNL